MKGRVVRLAQWSQEHLFPWLFLLLALEMVSWVIPEFPSIVQVLKRALIQYPAELAFREALLGSLKRMAIGYAGVCIFGIGMGLLLGRFRWLDNMMGTLVAAVNAMPGAA